MLTRVLICSVVMVVCAVSHGAQPYLDRKFDSQVFGGERNYRIFLPADYAESQQRYPVIYYFHGHSDRYTLEKYDDGTDTVPKIANFVAQHDAIVVAVDGYVKEHYTGFYGGSPWDVRIDGGDFDFGDYLQEMVAHVDGTYRTLTGRRFRATSGLSMGGFTSLFQSARYPQLIGSASSFNAGPEFYLGDKGRRVLWRPKDHVSNHGHTMVRLIRASGDYISQYHEETHAAYANAHDVDYEYRRDEYHRHWATSIDETFRFHMRAFENTDLDALPRVWSHANPYSSFSVWGYDVLATTESRAITYLTDVDQGGLRVATRRWAPDGPAVTNSDITIVTSPRYEGGAKYAVTDHNLATQVTTHGVACADAEGRLTVSCDGSGHQISFAGPGIGRQPPSLLPVTNKDKLRIRPGIELSLPLRIYNPNGDSLKNVKLKMSSDYPTVAWLSDSAPAFDLGAGQVADLPDQITVGFTAGGGYLAPTRLVASLSADGFEPRAFPIDVLVIPEQVPRPAEVEVLDGRSRTFAVFRQKGNQGGGSSIEREVREGKGNGNGVLEAGEEATIWVRMTQGLDPFDKSNWYRCKVYSDSPWLEEVGDIQEFKQLEWTGARERTSLVRLADDTPSNAEIELLLDNESWSYHFTPDVRYGRELLYQAFQLHRHHLHRFELSGRAD